MSRGLRRRRCFWSRWWGRDEDGRGKDGRYLFSFFLSFLLMPTHVDMVPRDCFLRMRA